MTAVPKSLSEFKEAALSELRADCESDAVRGPHLNVQLVESNVADVPSIPGCSDWGVLDGTGRWYVCDGPDGYFVLNKANDRVWALYSLMGVGPFVEAVGSWIGGNLKLDNCWIPQGCLRRTMETLNWTQRGIGLRFEDRTAWESGRTGIVIEARYGDDAIAGDLLSKAGEDLSIDSLRMRSLADDGTVSEWYTSGRITFDSSEDVDAAIYAVTDACDRYGDELKRATSLRDSERGSFEFEFSRDVDLDRYEAGVSKGASDLKLWMVKTEDQGDFRRFKGVDTHTWDTVFLDLGRDYAYMAVPGDGCVNAAPRLVAVMGEPVAGRTRVYCSGDEIFCGRRDLARKRGALPSRHAGDPAAAPGALSVNWQCIYRSSFSGSPSSPKVPTCPRGSSKRNPSSCSSL